MKRKTSGVDHQKESEDDHDLYQSFRDSDQSINQSTDHQNTGVTATDWNKISIVISMLMRLEKENSHRHYTG